MKGSELMSKVYICAAKRTPIGAMLGSLKNVHPAELGAIVVRNILEETKLDPKHVDELICGNVLSAGKGQGIGRQVSIKAGIPQEVPAYSLNMVCGSGMKAVINAYMSIKAGINNIVIAGGTENMSATPYLIPETTRSGVKMGGFKAVDHMVYDALTDAYSGVHMGITAENIAKKHNISREEQDEFAIRSQEKAIAAVDGGAFKEEIVPVVVKERKKEIVFDTDEYPNRTTSREKLATLRPAFDPNGTVTAGNASGINDGAAFFMVASEEAVKEYDLPILAEIVGVGQGGVDPQYMGLGPVAAIRNVLASSNVKLEELDVLELNEAFAAQSIGVVKEISKEHNVKEEDIYNKTNINGGAIALGHPVGASGARILVTLTYLLKHNKDYNLGLASLCIGGGMGTAVIIKKA